MSLTRGTTRRYTKPESDGYKMRWDSSDGEDPYAANDGEQPVKENTVWDYVFPTTHAEYSKTSIHGTDPRDNPEGGEAKHHGGA